MNEVNFSRNLLDNSYKQSFMDARKFLCHHQFYVNVWLDIIGNYWIIILAQT